ncbi:MAG: hypothetical protein CM15mP49_06190 [Actinomycetota bacterium]|nr:MAG: hypothetical protein CM15mP49_06190 [Actinomycetota bacterium]
MLHIAAYFQLVSFLIMPQAAIGMDCGIGPEGSAIAGLWFLEALNIPAAVADVMSAHLGNGYIYTNMGLLAFVINSQMIVVYELA